MLLPLFAQIETAVKAIDHAAQQTMLWFVIALLFALGAFAASVIRYLVKREDAREERDAKMMEARMNAIIDQNTLLRELRDLMDRIKKQLDRQA